MRTAPHQERILLIDDEPDDVELASEALQKENAHGSITIARTAEEGLALIVQQDWTMIFLDHKLPGKNGLELLPEIRLRAPDAGIVMLTGHEDTEIAIAALRAGADYYLKKSANMALELPLVAREVADKRDLRRALAQTTDRYRRLIENLSDLVYELDEKGCFHYVSVAVVNLLGYTPQELIGMPYSQILCQNHPPLHGRQFHERRTGLRATRELPIRMKTKTGEVKTFAVNASGIYERHRRFSGTAGIARDITERQQLAEREASRVRQLKKLYAFSMTLSGDPGVVFEHAVRIIGELFNVPVVCLSEIVGQELYFKSVYVNGQTLTDAGHCSLAITPCAMVEQTKDLRVFDRVMERFPQASFLLDNHQAVSYCGFPALDNEGRVIAVTCLLDTKPHEFSKEEQDLLRIFGQRIAVEIERSRHAAEQKLAADELRRSHAFIRQIIDADPNFIFVKNRAGQFTLVNKAVANAYGTTVEHLLGKTDADFNANREEVEFFRQKDLEVMDSLHGCFIAEEVITDSTGKTRWLQTVKQPVLDEQGRAIMVLGASTDITDRKRLEETLRQRERDLRTALEERERISQDLHDGILQSLFAVGLTLETAKSVMPPRARKTTGPPLDQAIDQLNRVMREIRNFIAGLGSDLLQGMDLPTALQHLVTSLTQNQLVRVRLAVEDRAAQAVSAEQSLHLLLVIQEAISNCIRHGHAQEATVSLKMRKQGVRLSIRDNGRGFNPKAATGTGHGLVNMATRARKIGGRFTVMSKVNEGTRIVLDLPKEAFDVRR